MKSRRSYSESLKLVSLEIFENSQENDGRHSILLQADLYHRIHITERPFGGGSKTSKIL